MAPGLGMLPGMLLGMSLGMSPADPGQGFLICLFLFVCFCFFGFFFWGESASGAAGMDGWRGWGVVEFRLLPPPAVLSQGFGIWGDLPVSPPSSGKGHQAGGQSSCRQM